MGVDTLSSLREILENYIKEKTEIPCEVMIYSTREITTNRIILQEPINIESSSTLNKEETISKLVYQIDIYSPLDFYNIKVDNETRNVVLPKIEQARALSLLVNDIFQKGLKFKRIMCSPMPNIDNNIYRITMQFRGNVIDNLKMFLK